MTYTGKRQRQALTRINNNNTAPSLPTNPIPSGSGQIPFQTAPLSTPAALETPPTAPHHQVGQAGCRLQGFAAAGLTRGGCDALALLADAVADEEGRREREAAEATAAAAAAAAAGIAAAAAAAVAVAAAAAAATRVDDDPMKVEEDERTAAAASIQARCRRIGRV